MNPKRRRQPTRDLRISGLLAACLLAGNEYLAVVSLYRALGGGWSPGAISSAKQGL